MFLQKDSIRNCNVVIKKFFAHDTASFSKAQTGLHDRCMNPSKNFTSLSQPSEQLRKL